MAKTKVQTNQLLDLRGVGKQVAKHLARLEIYSPQDLLFHLPARYQDRTRVLRMHSLTPGEEAVIEGVITDVSTPSRGRTKKLYEIKDETGKVYLRFFHVVKFQEALLQSGNLLRCYGTVRLGSKGLEMFHPECKVMTPENPLPIEPHLTPIYPATEGLTQYSLRKITDSALAFMRQANVLQELIPATLLQTLAFPTLKEAVQFVHRPPCETAVEALQENKTLEQQRLVFEELLAYRLSLLKTKQTFRQQPGVALTRQQTLSTAFLSQLPFHLTSAQLRVSQEIQADLSRSQPMLRLVQGDVGSGKTVVAALAMLQTVESGYQAALMAPTELLAEQHHRTFKRWLLPLGIQVEFLTGSVKAAARKKSLQAIADGNAKIVIGTHALFQEAVQFSKLALIVVDEQHRFGVEQRALFREKGMQQGCHPHQLVMTATPIPRTLAMSVYADLDSSVIDELPPGRTPIKTIVMADDKRQDVIARIREACKEGKQVYWVCPLIEESELLNCQAASKTVEQLQMLLPNLKIGLIHGRLRATEKEEVMRAFQRNEIHLLVATTVIEVGVDVPNASVMIIENAERLGLSQLHQLRGRVGRGSVASFCVLLYQQPLSRLAKERLSLMRETTDGFKIAQRDLELRGPGEVLGTRQTGDLSFYVADLMRDNALLADVNHAADTISKQHPECIEPLIARWLGRTKEYSKV
ncbi:MAG: ATP-dependent DNA helicase RecG [Gammaproteobacteria bacterium RIFCSPHIGHO2_12_FULL_43_28]|nr:MAG: ATP-dependent DNA helicase RecG [Gammaproteobacteria bacterium RIFCSPHIGHO2_12_FULL_43_28]